MGLFIFFALTVLVYLYGSNKYTNTANRNDRLSKSKTNKKMFVDPAYIDLASKHLGYEWENFIRRSPSSVKISNREIIQILAQEYQNLPENDIKDLILSFLNVETGAVGTGIGISLSVNLNNYSELHLGIYNLLKREEFKGSTVASLLNRLINAKRDDRRNNSLNHTHVSEVDNSIEEVSGRGLTIGYQASNNDFSAYPNYDPDEFKLGNRYKKKLSLNSQEVVWLNKFWNYGNVFNSIEGCRIEIIKLYLSTIKILNKRLKKGDVTLTSHVNAIKEEARKYYANMPGYWSGYNDDAITEADIYHTIYKKAESVIRIKWQHKRKISSEFHSQSQTAIDLFKSNLEPLIDDIIAGLIEAIPWPDDDTEKELNVVGTTRWREQLAHHLNQYTGVNSDSFLDNLRRLVKLNEKNPAIANIWFEISKLLAPIDKVESLNFYLHYLHYELKKKKTDFKSISKGTQKKVFKNEQQLQTFQKVIDDLIANSDLETALVNASDLFTTKRKIISIDSTTVKKVQEQHSGTVSILSEYLKDEEDLDNGLISEDISMVKDLGSLEVQTNNFTSINNGILFTSTQLDLLDLFKSNSLTLSYVDIETFLKSKGVFKNQTIDSINELCFEILDDILIEDDGSEYNISPSYFAQIYLT